MRIEQIGMCRSGNGKVYVKLQATGLPEGEVIKPLIQDEPESMNLPCELYELPEESQGTRLYVLVAPIIPGLGSGTCALGAYDAELNLRDNTAITIDFEEAKKQSRKNRLMNKSLIREIERYDEGHDRSGVLKLSFIRIMSSSTHIIAEFEVSLPYIDPSNINVAVLNQNLQKLEEPIFMGSSKRHTQAANTDYRLHATYSIRVPWDQQMIYILISDLSRDYYSEIFFVDRAQLDRGLQASESLFLDAGNDPYYPEWFKAHRISEEDLETQRGIRLESMPSFSIIVPLYKTPLPLFVEMLASVVKQSYANWELLLVNASPEDSELSKRVADAARSDSRIKVITLEKNLGISLNTNAGIDAATGDFISFFDHDDVLEPNLLFEYSSAINAHEDIDLLYCDEDKLDLEGNFCAPFFKPDFNIDHLRSQNYICHMLTIRSSLLKMLEPNVPEFDGAQDHNLTFEAVEKARRVWHVPHILYHWRMTPNSTSANADSKSYATEAGIKVVKAHLQRLGLKANVTPGEQPFSYRVHYLPPSSNPLVSVIIPTRSHPEVLKRCVDSIVSKSTYPNYEIILVENNSKDPATFALYDKLTSEHEQVRVVRYDGSFNFSKIINFGVESAKGDYLLLLNNDTEVITPEWMTRLVGLCSREDVGCAGVRLYFPNDTIQHAGVVINYPQADHLGLYMPRGRWGYFELFDKQRDLSAVTAACMMTTRKAFELVGGFEESIGVAYNDVDYCLKLRDKGLLVVYTPEVELYHYESLSRGYDEDTLSRARYIKELGTLLQRHPLIFAKGDPYFTPNINPDSPMRVNYYHF